jgi:hypothetical protein
MDEFSQQTRKPKGFDAIITAINMAALGAGIAAAVVAANKSKSTSGDAERVEKSVNELNAKFDKISEQLKGIQQPSAKIEVPATTTKEVEKKPDGMPQQQPKPQDVIYVRKSSEFSFYN